MTPAQAVKENYCHWYLNNWKKMQNEFYRKNAQIVQKLSFLIKLYF